MMNTILDADAHSSCWSGEVTLHKLHSSIYEAAGHDGKGLLVLVARSRCGDGGTRVTSTYQGVSPELFQNLLSARSTTRFFQQAIWERYPSQPVSSNVLHAIEQFLAMQPEGTIPLTPAARSRNRASTADKQR